MFLGISVITHSYIGYIRTQYPAAQPYFFAIVSLAVQPATVTDQLQDSTSLSSASIASSSSVLPSLMSLQRLQNSSLSRVTAVLSLLVCVVNLVFLVAVRIWRLDSALFSPAYRDMLRRDRADC